MKIITLPDGYNGHAAKFNAEPIDVDGNLVKLQCVEPGKEYMTRWARIEDVKASCHTCPDCGSDNTEIIEGAIFQTEANHSGECAECGCAWTID